MEQLFLSAITQHIQDNWEIRPNQHGFRKDMFCLTNLSSFCDRVTPLVNEEKAVVFVYIDFRRVSDIISHSIFLAKLAVQGLDGCTLGWV